jgi:SAM-dependent methyltransferase
MIDLFEQALPGAQVVGIEFSPELAGLARDRGHRPLRADVCMVPLREGVFDAVVGCAVIEHLRQPLRMIEEARRVLRRGGLVLLTSPSPFWEHVATAVGHLADDQHHFALDIPAIVQMLRATGFGIVATEKFMLSPVGMPAERSVEVVLRKAGMGWLLANQIVVGRRL